MTPMVQNDHLTPVETIQLERLRFAAENVMTQEAAAGLSATVLEGFMGDLVTRLEREVLAERLGASSHRAPFTQTVQLERRPWWRFWDRGPSSVTLSGTIDTQDVIYASFPLSRLQFPPELGQPVIKVRRDEHLLWNRAPDVR